MVLALSREGEKNLLRQFAPAWRIVFFLGALSLLSWLGSADLGGRGTVPGGVDTALVAAMAVGTHFWAVRSHRGPPRGAARPRPGPRRVRGLGLGRAERRDGSGA